MSVDGERGGRETRGMSWLVYYLCKYLKYLVYACRTYQFNRLSSIIHTPHSTYFSVRNR